jgi:hypothetical protein
MNKVMATTTTRRPGRSRSGSAMTAPHRAIRALRYVNEELVRASEAISRSAGTATRPRAGVPAGKMPAQLPLRNALTGPPGLGGSPPSSPAWWRALGDGQEAGGSRRKRPGHSARLRRDDANRARCRCQPSAGSRRRGG